MFSAWFAGAVTSMRTSGDLGSTSCTVLPAASMISPPGAVMMPLFSTLGAIRYTAPPVALIVPWLERLAAPGVSVKRNRPAWKS